MSVYIDRKYLMFISSRLRNFKERKTDLFNFSCPYCGDSSKNKSKARGYIFMKQDNYFYMCHNCNVSTTFGKFLEYIDSEQHKSYIFERYTNGQSKYAPVEKPDVAAMVKSEAPKQIKHISDFKGIDTLPDGHFAKEYVRHRKIPEKFWKEIVFAPGYKSWLDENFPNHGKKGLLDDPRLVLFYTNHAGEITNVSGRALANADALLRYITVKVSEQRKVFGLHRLDFKKKVYIVEGQFDSFFIDNAVASGDANLSALADYLYDTYGANCVLVFDNEPRNKQIVNSMAKNLDNTGWDMVIFPESFPGKDINEAIIAGLTTENIQSIMEIHTYGGLSAALRLSEWRRC